MISPCVLQFAVTLPDLSWLSLPKISLLLLVICNNAFQRQEVFGMPTRMKGRHVAGSLGEAECKCPRDHQSVGRWKLSAGQALSKAALGHSSCHRPEGRKTQGVAALSQNLIYSQNLCCRFHAQRLEMQLHINVLASYAPGLSLFPNSAKNK